MPFSARSAKKRAHEESVLRNSNKSIKSFFNKSTSSTENVGEAGSSTTCTTTPTASQRNVTQHDLGLQDQQCEQDPNAAKEKPKHSHHAVGTKAVLSLNFEWLEIKNEYDISLGKDTPVLYCKLCRKHDIAAPGGSQAWNREGFKTLRKDRVKDHLKGVQHKKAQQVEAQLELNKAQDSNHSSEDLSVAQCLMEIVYYMACNNTPLDQFAKLVDLCIKTGSRPLMATRQSVNATYTSPESMHSLLKSFSDKVDEHILPQVKKSPTYALMLDEVCDKAVIKNLGVVVKYIDLAGAPTMKFLNVTEMIRSTGEDIKDATLKILQEKDINPHSCTNLTSDGASSFSGKHKGAARLLKTEAMPNASIMHCHDHRLALACRDAFTAVKDLDIISEGLESLYKYYSYSSVSSATLRLLQDVYKQAHWRIQQAKHHRWLSYDKAVVCVLKGLDLIRQDLENACTDANPNRNNFTEKHKTDANALSTRITSEKTLRMLCMLGDILPHLAELSLVFQRKSVDLSYIQPKLESTLAILENRKQNPGPWEKKLLETDGVLAQPIRKRNCTADEFHTKIKLPFLESLSNNISLRFANIDVISSLSALSVPLDLIEELPSLYREEDIRNLAQNFELEEDTLLEEWIGWIGFLKGLDHSSYFSENSSSLALLGKLLYQNTTMSQDLNHTYPNLSYLYSVANTMCLSSAEVERLFSHLKIVKTDRRSSLSNKVLNWILNIKLNVDSDVVESLKSDAAKLWVQAKKRRFGHYLCL